MSVNIGPAIGVPVVPSSSLLSINVESSTLKQNSLPRPALILSSDKLQILLKHEKVLPEVSKKITSFLSSRDYYTHPEKYVTVDEWHFYTDGSYPSPATVLFQEAWDLGDKVMKEAEKVGVSFKKAIATDEELVEFLEAAIRV